MAITTATKSTAKKSTTRARTSKAQSTPVQVRTKAATSASASYTPRSAAYAYLGAADLAIEKAKDVSGKVISTIRDLRDPSELTADAFVAYGKVFQDLSARGEKVARRISGSAYTRRALDQTKVAQRQIKAATTSVRKAVETATTATLEAAKKVS